MPRVLTQCPPFSPQFSHVCRASTLERAPASSMRAFRRLLFRCLLFMLSNLSFGADAYGTGQFGVELNR